VIGCRSGLTISALDRYRQLEIRNELTAHFGFRADHVMHGFWKSAAAIEQI